MINYILQEKIGDAFPFYIERTTVLRDFQEHTHDFTEIVVVTEGESSHTLEGFRYQIGAGDVFVIRGNKSHGFSDVKHLTIYNIMIMEDVVFEPFEELRRMAGFQALFYLEPYYRSETGFRYRLKLDSTSLGYVQYLLSDLLSEYQNKKDGYISLVRSRFIELIVYLSRHFSAANSMSRNSITGLSGAVAYMESHFTEELKLAALAEYAMMSQRQFDRVFLNVYGVTPFEYLTRLRLSRACTLLRAEAKSITEIAYDCGFRDANYFSRRFKKEYGITPREIRKYLI